MILSTRCKWILKVIGASTDEETARNHYTYICAAHSTYLLLGHLMHVEIAHNKNTGVIRAYVEAPLGTNANSMRAAARAKMNATPCPEYELAITGAKAPGKWAQNLGSSAEWKVCAPDKQPAKRLYWNLAHMPDWSKN